MGKIIGIDLGTTNSVVAVVEDGTARVLADAAGDRLIPSVVGVSPEGGLLVGAEALRQYVLHPESTVRSIKRRMGTDHKVHLGGKTFTPPEISALILKKLRLIAETELGEGTKAVITVPAYFADAQRQATKDAGELAGLEVVRIINEPTAAALVYTLDSGSTERVMVYDLGGGTFDVSIVEISGEVTEVLASHGNNMLGGDDFDRLLQNHLVQEFERAHGVDLRGDAVAIARLLRAAERAKIELSSHGFVDVNEEFLSRRGKQPLHLATTISRQSFETMIRPMIDSTIASVERALEDARLDRGAIDRVILAGGSTRIPLVHDLLQERLGRTLYDGIDPDLCVAMGAAYQGAVIAGEEIDSVLVDVTPYSIGVSTVADHPLHGIMTDLFSVIIPRNTVVPVSRSQLYSNPIDNMDRICVSVYQGEQPRASENIEIGSFWITDLPPMPSHAMKIDVHFDLDVDGILHVTAHDQVTGKKQSMTFTRSNSELAAARRQDVQKKIDDLWATYDDLLVLDATPEQVAESMSAPVADASALLTGHHRDVYQTALEILPTLGSRGEADDLRALLDELLDAAESGSTAEVQRISSALEDVLYYLRS